MICFSRFFYASRRASLPSYEDTYLLIMPPSLSREERMDQQQCGVMSPFDINRRNEHCPTNMQN